MDSALEQTKYTIAVVGGGAAATKFLAAAGKLPQEMKDQLDIVIIDAKDYMETQSAMQRFLALPEKARFGTIPYADLVKAVGMGRFVHGTVERVTKKNKVRQLHVLLI